MAYDEITKPLSVSEANSLIKGTLDESFYQIVVKGEVSGFRPSQSGHAYFDLKDSNASLPSVVFRSSLLSMPRFQNGDLVVATGRVSLYEKSGKLSFIITRLTNAGDGELQAMIEKRKLYYSGLGWFDPAVKKPLPKEIKTLGIVTSATGAVFHDILDVTRRRAPGLDIVLFPCAVQGDGADETIASRIRQANNFDNVDVLIVGRGGGSQEDLSPFSSDSVIAAIHESHIPVVSAVGHEVDWALSDYVADVRAGTPSIAAEMVTKDIFQKRGSVSTFISTMNMTMENRILSFREKIPSPSILTFLMERKISSLRLRLSDPSSLLGIVEKKIQDGRYRSAMCEDDMARAIKEKERSAREKLSSLTLSLSSSLPPKITEARFHISSLEKEMESEVTARMKVEREKLEARKREVEALSPLSVLKRGYAVVSNKNGRVIVSPSQVRSGDQLNIRVEKGTIRTVVREE
ncbi:MAG: exodeoxyribonuclease VII large subunit [Candidatus Ornithospirochaeta sp.]